MPVAVPLPPSLPAGVLLHCTGHQLLDCPPLALLRAKPQQPQPSSLAASRVNIAFHLASCPPDFLIPPQTRGAWSQPPCLLRQANLILCLCFFGFPYFVFNLFLNCPSPPPSSCVSPPI
uniref:Uncharacterized protein n=1 Tax=Bionectria ochroleuca TaxID=29856 RepID=A0A8H7NJK9_BIOOC